MPEAILVVTAGEIQELANRANWLPGEPVDEQVGAPPADQHRLPGEPAAKPSGRVSKVHTRRGN